jgi:hypothetical protein
MFDFDILNVLDTTEVSYTQAGVTEVFTVSVGTSWRDSKQGQRVISISNRVDILLSADVFPFDTPAIGDTVSIDTKSYRVTPLGEEPHWRYSDPQRTRMRIHLLEIA